MKKSYFGISLAVILMLFSQQKSFSQSNNKVGVTITQAPITSVKVEYVSHVKCAGEAKGAINISVLGGVPPYSYKWSNGDTTQDIAGIKAGTYRVWVSDIHRCLDSVTVEVNEPTKMEVKVDSIKDILCFGHPSGSINLDVTGGIEPYRFSWSRGDKTKNVEGLTAGTYSVLILDDNGCQEIISATVEQKPLIVRKLNAGSGILCHNDTTGKINLRVTGGIAPYQFQWSNGSKSKSLDGLVAGEYSVVVKDAGNCIETSVIELKEPSPLEVKIDEIKQIKCHGEPGGAVHLTVHGGTGPYTYAWNSGQKTQDISGIKAGDYKVQIKDKNQCLASIATSVKEPPLLKVELAETGNVSYYGGKNGKININVDGGVSPYKYSWSNGAETKNISQLSAGNYSIRVSDKTGCYKMVNATINQPAKMEARIEQTVDVSCYGNKSGSINIGVTGGVIPYKYNWNNGATTQDLKDLPAGSYQVVISDANGFTQTLKTTIKQPEKFEVKLVDVKNNACFGDKKGEINLSASGGVAPYDYMWSNGANSQDIHFLGANNYKVKVYDDNGCEQSLEAEVKQSNKLITSINSINHVKCNGGNNGSVDINVTGGTAPYKYIWNHGATRQDVSALSAGTYELKITDNKGCFEHLTTQVKEPAVLQAKKESITDVKCSGEKTGGININVRGGTEPYTYLWSNSSTNEDLESIGAGSYSVKINDANGCQEAVSATVKQPEKLVASISKVKNINCFGDRKGEIDVVVTGGSGKYAYKWSNGAVTQDIAGVEAGKYEIRIKDSNGCNLALDATVKQNAELEPVFTSTEDIKCNGDNKGKIDATVKGGVAPYTYKWSNGATTQDLLNVSAGNYSLLISDSKGCTKNLSALIREPRKFVAEISEVKQINCYGKKTGSVALKVSGGVTPYSFAWSNTASTQNIKDLPKGVYSVTAKDANGCSERLSASIEQPTPIVEKLVSTSHVSCSGNKEGSINISVVGGTAPYRYKWSNEATTQDISDLPAGNYKVQIRDAKGCIKELESKINEPKKLTIKEDELTHINCYGDNKGAIKISVAGGTIPYKYSWSNGMTSEDVYSIEAGSYTVNVSDAKGCVATHKATIKQPTKLSASIQSVTHVKCFGEKTGAIVVSSQGGIKPYTFSWNNGESTESISGQPAGNYTLNLKDSKGCQLSIKGSIDQPNEFKQVLTKVENVRCHGDNSGNIDITVTGGTPPFKYKWNNEQTSQDLLGVKAGKYSVIMSDANGCKGKKIEASITQPEPLTASISKVTEITNFGQNSGAINIAVKGGSSPYSYSWSNGSTSQQLINVKAGEYYVNVRDQKGCVKTLRATIKEPQKLVSKIKAVRNIKCFGEKTGAIAVEVSGGVKPYKFAWSNGNSTQDLQNISAGTYTLTVSDANGVTRTLKSTVEQPEKYRLKVEKVKNISCYGTKDGAVNITITGGSAPYKYAWNNGITTQDLAKIGAGKYEVKVTDIAGCQQSAEINVTQPKLFTAKVTERIHNKCADNKSGQIKIDVTGGVEPYRYSWSNGEVTKNLSSLKAGTYSVSISDENKCLKNLSAVIKTPNELLVSKGSITHNKCHGKLEGAATLLAKGGTGKYHYTWSTGDTTSSLKGVGAGKYVANVQDENGCSKSIDVNINAPGDLFATIADIQNEKCFNKKEGSVTLEVSGGTMPYSYRWNNGGKTKDLDNIPAGKYDVSISDKNGCIKTLSAEVEQPEQLTTNITSFEHIKCNGNREGSIQASIAGGTAPYTFNWSNGASSKNLKNVAAGNYTIMVTDGNDCFSESKVTLKEPTELMVSIDSVKNLKCYGDKKGAISITAKGGVEPYKYTWSNGDTLSKLAAINAGEYKSTVTDANGCSTSLTTSVSQPNEMMSSLDAIVNLRCHNDNSGEVHLTVLGGTPPFSYKWSNNATTQDLVGVPAGEYSVQIKEGNNCISTLKTELTQPPSFLAEVEQVKHVNCFGEETGQVTLNVSGGIAPYNYHWSNGTSEKDLKNIIADHYSALITDANGCLNTVNAQINQPEELLLAIDSVWNVKCCGDSSGAIFISVSGGVEPYKYEWTNGVTTQDIRGLKMGRYEVEVNDANGCQVGLSENEMTLYDKIINEGMFTSRTIRFDVALSEIKLESFPEVNKIATLMKDHPDLRFSIEGHTDSDGSSYANQKLSEERSSAIRDALIQFGIDPSRLKWKGWGESKPVDTNTTRAGKANNRRVEFILLKGDDVVNVD